MQLQSLARRFAPLAISLVSIGLYVGSLFLPALILERGTLRGTHVLAFGWYGLLLMNLAWFANAGYAYALSQMLCMRYRRARWAIVVAIVLSTQSWMADSWWFDEGRGTPITSLGSGYCLRWGMTVGMAYTDKPYGALMLDELEDYQEVIASLSAHIERGVSVGAALHNRGLARWEIGEPDQALQDFDEAAVQLPESHMPFQLKGMLLQKLGRPDEALDAFNRAVAASPNQATVRRARALLLRELGRPKDALLDFEYAIALEPAFARTREDRDATLAALAKLSPKPWWKFWR